MPKRDTLAGWVFFGVGLCLIEAHRLTLESPLHARAYSELLFPTHLSAQFCFMGYFTFAAGHPEAAAASICR